MTAASRRAAGSTDLVTLLYTDKGIEATLKIWAEACSKRKKRREEGGGGEEDEERVWRWGWGELE